MVKQDPPKIVFPCSYSLRVIGSGHQTFRQDVIDIVKLHDNRLDETQVRLKQSAKGNFHSVYLLIEAQSEDHLKAIFDALKNNPDVKMVI